MAQKRLATHQRVSGAYGDFIEGPTKRRRRQRLYGQIVCAVGEKKYLVRFDNGVEKECSSNTLRVENMNEALPPDMPLANPVTREEQRQVEENEDVLGDQEEEELEEELEDDIIDDANNDSPGDEEVPNGMPGQLPSEDQQPKDYATIKQQAKEKIAAMVGHEITVSTRSNGAITWKVIAANDPKEIIPEKESIQYGLKGFDIESYKKSEIFVAIFLQLAFKNWKEKVVKMNEAVQASKAKVRDFTQSEFLMGLAILVGAAEFAKRGSDLFSVNDQAEGNEEKWVSLCPDPQFEKLMPFYRWKEFRRFFPCIFEDASRKDSDPWWQFSSAVDDFNSIRRDLLSSSRWISIDETMSAWQPRKTALGGLPNISFIARKPEPLGKFRAN